MENEKMTKEELLELFSKYDLEELGAINTILCYSKENDAKNIIRTIKVVSNEFKEDNKKNTLSYTHEISIINKKENLLTKKEAKYLLELVDSANKYLESVELFEPDVYVESDLLELDKVRDSLNSIMLKESKTLKLSLK
mgnify:FL=1